jgi:hypothetical protein
MSAHLSNEIVERFHSHSLATGDRGVIYEHILGCETCRQRVVTSQAEAVALQALTNHVLPQEADEPYHLDQSTIEAFLDDSLDALDRSTVKLHLEDCAQCSDEVTDLRESLATMRAVSRQHEESQPIKVAPVTRASAFSIPIRIAAAVTLIAVATVALILFSRWRSTPVQGPGTGGDATAGSKPTPVVSPQIPGVAPSPEFVNPPKLAENPPVKGPVEKQEGALVAIKDGPNEIILDRTGTVTGLQSLPTEFRQSVKEALSGEPLARPDVLDEVTPTQVSERAPTGNEERIKIAHPINTVILNNQPTLRWSPSKTAESYRVEIADETFHQVAKSDDLPATAGNWKPPTQLKRGAIYIWTIRAVNKGGQPSALTSQAKFKVLGEDRIRRLNRLKTGSRSHLALGLFYAREGMINEAEREFGILVRQNPDSAVAKNLLREVRAWRKR